MQKLKSQRVIMIVFMKEMDNNLNPTWRTLEKGGNSRGNILRTYEKMVSLTAHLCRQRLDTFLLIGERVVLRRT